MKTHYKYPNTKQREFSHFETFRILFKDFKIDSWEKREPPCPDFVIKTDNSVIGVEVTTPSSDHRLWSIRDSQRKCLEKAKKIAIQSNLDPIEVKVGFISNSMLIDEKEAAKELFDFVKSQLINIPGMMF